MVGVPGRSKACANCKSRRIKCDETRPSCNRCQKAGLQCPGYKKETKFVDETHWTQGKHHEMIIRLSSSSSSSSSSASDALSRPSFSSLSSSILPTSTSTYFRSSAELHRALDVSVIQFLRGIFHPRGSDFTSWHHHQQQQQYHNTTTYNTSSRGDHPLRTATSTATVMSKRPFLPGVTLQALALALHGQKTKSYASILQAAELYGFAVRNLRMELMSSSDYALNAISSSRPAFISLVDSILNLCLYETIQFQNVPARNSHIQALAKLIEMQGPHAFRQGQAQRLFRKARSMLAVMALEENKDTFLANEEWQIIPWELEGGRGHKKKNFVDRFMDILLCTCGLRRDLDILLKMPAEQGQERKRIVFLMRQTIASLNDRLSDIRLDWEILKPGVAYEVPMTDINSDNGKFSVDDKGNPLFDSIIYYHDLQSCIEIGVYDTCLFILRGIAGLIGGVTTSTTTLGNATANQKNNKNNIKRTNPALKFPDEMTTRRDIGREICRSVEYYLQPSHGISGAYFLVLPLRMAQHAFLAEEDRQLAKWICTTMRYMGDTHGLHHAYAFCNGVED